MYTSIPRTKMILTCPRRVNHNHESLNPSRGRGAAALMNAAPAESTSDDHRQGLGSHAGNKNTPSMRHPRKRNVTTSMFEHVKISPKIVNPDILAGKAEQQQEILFTTPVP